MLAERKTHIIKLFLVCVLATAGNMFLILTDPPRLPLFLDTVFTVAVTFALGFFPGLAVAVLTWTAAAVRWAIHAWMTDGVRWAFDFHPFIIVAIIEVLLVHKLRPIDSAGQNRPVRFASLPEKKLLSFVGIFVRLLLVYGVCVVVISVTGGIIDFVNHTVSGAERLSYYNAIHALRMAFLQREIPILGANIFARIQINMADRFIVIFGGYLVSLGIRKVFRRKKANDETMVH